MGRRHARCPHRTVDDYYRATVDDPDTWSTAWTLEFPFVATRQRIFEYACHEGNYAVEGILRGARADEKAAAKK